MPADEGIARVAQGAPCEGNGLVEISESEQAADCHALSQNRNITWQLLELLDGFVKLSVGRNRRVTDTVEWLNVKDQCGFIDRSDACDDICFHRASILRNIQQKTRGSMRKG